MSETVSADLRDLLAYRDAVEGLIVHNWRAGGADAPAHFIDLSFGANAEDTAKWKRFLAIRRRALKAHPLPTGETPPHDLAGFVEQINRGHHDEG